MININLLPPELKLKRINAKRNAGLISLCIIGILAVGILGVIARSLESTIETYLGAMKGNIEKDTNTLDQYQDIQELALLINDRWQTTQKINQGRVFWSQALSDLNNSVPANIQFENVTIKTDKTPNFILQGNTTTEREIIKFKEKLENSVFFQNVTFKSSSIIKNQSQTEGQLVERLSFTLEFDLEKKQNIK